MIIHSSMTMLILKSKRNTEYSRVDSLIVVY